MWDECLWTMNMDESMCKHQSQKWMTWLNGCGCHLIAMEVKYAKVHNDQASTSEANII